MIPARHGEPTPAASPTPRVPLARVERVGITHDGAPSPSPTAVSFEVAPGEVVLLLGPSGSGKSTLALAMNGLIPHAIPAAMTGTITVAGRLTTHAPVSELSQSVAMVFQDPDAQLVTGTLFDEVAFAPENLLVGRREIEERVEDALRQVGLWERRDENPDHLSGGGRQRLAIACALAMRSPLLVLDEPTANLDPAGVEDTFAALADVVARGEHGILLVEHNLDAAVDLVSRVVVLDADGRTRFDGATGDVLRTHARDLHDLGVWLPSATLAALKLEDAGYAFPRLPLTPAELRTALTHAATPDLVPEPPRAPRASGDTIARASGLTLARGDTTVLRDIELTVSSGEFVAIVGANGAGKTTLLQALAGVIRAPRGRVQVGGIDPGRSRARVRAQKVGFVFQNPEHQFITAHVHAELAHGLRLQKLTDDEVEARVDDLLRRFALTGKSGAHPFLLSGGQKRRLSVGTALVAGAPLLALDEPTFGQDRARADELMSLLDALNAGGTTVLIVTHDMQLVAEHADRVVVMAGGSIVADGAPHEVLSDRDVLQHAGLRVPPLAEAFRELPAEHPLFGVTRLRDLPKGAA